MAHIGDKEEVVVELIGRVRKVEARVDTIETEILLLRTDLNVNGTELRANTALCKQMHEAIFGRDGDADDLGLKGKVEKMHEAFLTAEFGFKFLNNIATFVTKAAKPVLFLVAAVTAIKLYLSTGVWVWPKF